MKKIDLRVPNLNEDYLNASLGYCLKLLLESKDNPEKFAEIATEILAQIKPESVSVSQPKYLYQDGWQVEVNRCFIVMLEQCYPKLYQQFIEIYPNAVLTEDESAFCFWGREEDVERIFIEEFDPEQAESKYIKATGRYVCEKIDESIPDMATTIAKLIPKLVGYLQEIKQNAPIRNMPLTLKIKHSTLIAFQTHPLGSGNYSMAIKEYLAPIASQKGINTDLYHGNVIYLDDGTEVAYFASDDARRTIWYSQMSVDRCNYNYDYNSTFFVTNAINRTLSKYRRKSKLSEVLPICWSFINMGEGKCRITEYSHQDIIGKEQILNIDKEHLKWSLREPLILEFDGLYLKSIKDEETKLMRKVTFNMSKIPSKSH